MHACYTHDHYSTYACISAPVYIYIYVYLFLSACVCARAVVRHIRGEARATARRGRGLCHGRRRGHRALRSAAGPPAGMHSVPAGASVLSTARLLYCTIKTIDFTGGIKKAEKGGNKLSELA